MSDDLARAIPLAIIGVTTACFAVGMAVRAFRRDGLHWPASWRALVAAYLASLAAIALASSARRFGFAGYDASVVTGLLWVAALLSVWTFLRWVRSESDGGTA